LYLRVLSVSVGVTVRAPWAVVTWNPSAVASIVQCCSITQAFEQEAANLVFQLVSSLYERASLILTSNTVPLMRCLWLPRSFVRRGNAGEHSAHSGLDDAYRILPGKGR